jgi:peroxiredoxin
MQKLLLLSFLTLTSAVMAAAPPGVGDTAPDFTLADLTGTPRKLSSFTAEGRVVLVVLRGFPGYQCPLCNRQVGELVKNAEGFAKTGVRVVMVYPGPRDVAQSKANEFVSDKNLPQHFTLLVDPDYQMVGRYSLRWDAPKETAYPSTFVMNRSGKITFAKVSDSHGGRSTAAEILAELAKR